jgi:hypothetical protein
VTIKCEACGNSNVRTSCQKEPIDAVQAQKGQTPYRCRDCRTRFYAEVSAEHPAKKGRRSRSRGLRALLKQHKRAVHNASIFLLVLGLFFLCLLYLMNYHPDSESGLMHPVGIQESA